jgi:hypothetical protein
VRPMRPARRSRVMEARRRSTSDLTDADMAFVIEKRRVALYRKDWSLTAGQ